ncbi:MAG: AIR carboxylase family protein, partial [Planctomycetota bacterium]
MNTPRVLIVMGSDSDFEVMKECAHGLRGFGIDFDMRVCSAHRTPDAAHELSTKARENGIQVIVAAAGLAAHLAGVMAAGTTLPVIGVPL